MVPRTTRRPGTQLRADRLVTPKCAVSGCGRSSDHGSTFCHSHYEYQRRTGLVPTEPFLDTPEKRFFAKVDKTEDHWMWKGALASEGRYGAFYWQGRSQPAHVAAYEMFVAPVPAGLDIDHLCRVTLCVRPEHLEPVPHRENIMRGEGICAKQAAQTHCFRGHIYSPESTSYRQGRRTACRCATYRRLVKFGRIAEAEDFLVRSRLDPTLRFERAS